VDISWEAGIIPKVLITDPGPMTGNTVVLHRWGFFNNVACYQTTTQLIGSADVTLAACGMTLFAMVTEGLMEGRSFTEVTSPCFEFSRETAKRGMQAGIMEKSNITVTDSTALFGRVSYYSEMGSVFLFGAAITTMTNYAAYLAMNIF
jgi:hypothetical protein